ncbi:MAG TPA: hypothetical protein PLU45_04665, partial [Bacteroidales bacterium]|nr:hypothetical protein [Bacteroidales bacterium]
MKHFKTILVFVILATLNSCNKNEMFVDETTISSKNSIHTFDIPFSGDAILSEIDANPENVPYKTARTLVVLEMELGIKESMNWNGAKVSEKPIVVFDDKSRAKYYEFIVTDESGKALGTVTACAQKETDAAVSHVLPYVRDYATLTTKGGNYQLISGGYPSRILLGVVGKAGNEPSAVIDPETNETVNNIVSEDAQGMIEALLLLSDEEKEKLEITDLESIILNIEQKDALNREYAETFWTLIDTLEAELNTMTDEDIIKAVNESKASWTTFDEYRIPAYNTTAMKNTRWNGWCGPSALAWIYRGLYTSYNGTYLPLVGDASFSNPPYRRLYGTKGYYDFNDKDDYDNDKRQNDLDPDWVNPQSKNADGGLYAKLAQSGGLYLWPMLTGNQNGPTLPFGLSLAFTSVTNGKYSVSSSHFSLLSLEPLGHQHIRNNKLPIVCLVNTLSHYVVAFGSKYEYWNWDVVVKILGKKITLLGGSVRTDKW